MPQPAEMSAVPVLLGSESQWKTSAAMASAGMTSAGCTAEVQKKLRQQMKKLRQIEELKKRSSLDAEAQRKLDSEQEIRDEIASLESQAAHVQGDQLRVKEVGGDPLSLFQDIEAAVADVPSDAALLLGFSEKRFREQLRSLRTLLKLRDSEKLDALQQAKLDRLVTEAPELLRDFLPLRTEALRLAAAGGAQTEIKDLKAERERAQREATESGKSETPAVPSAPSVPPPRIGVDVGGCLNRYLNDHSSAEAEAWELSADSAAPGAMNALAELVKFFGQENTFILSKCSGVMQKKTETWLFKTMAICKPEIGVLRKNVHFCPQRYGQYGKGGTAKRLNLDLSHFVDDRDDCLWSVYEEGNSKTAVDCNNGKFFHMARGANGKFPPKPKEWDLDDRPGCVVPVKNWSEVLGHLRISSSS